MRPTSHCPVRRVLITADLAAVMVLVPVVAWGAGTAATQEPHRSDGSERVASGDLPVGQAGSGMGALWVVFGILLLLGGTAALAGRRRPEPQLTHEVEQ